MCRVKILILCCLISFQSKAYAQVRLAIMPFLSRTPEVSETQAAKVTDFVIRTLQASRSISVIERERLRLIAQEQGINFSSQSLSQASAVKIGNLAGCQYILLGSITQLSERYISKNEDFKNKYAREAMASIEARVIDIATGRVILSFSKKGSALKTTESDKRKKTFSINASFSFRELAIENAASRLGDKIREALVNEYAMIITINKNNIRINRGSSSGVKADYLYKVYQEGEEIFDLNGKSLGRKVVDLALLRVTDTQNEFSRVEVLNNIAATSKSKKDNKYARKKNNREDEAKTTIPLIIREGDKIELISFSESEKIVLSPQRIR